jgi:hypothetical protein
MIVYKYLHPDRIDVLRNGLIRFTQPAALNDPFETRPNLREIRRFFQTLHRNAEGVIPTEDDLRGTQEAISETFGRWNEDNASDLVFLSLSRNRNNLLMWSHYCDCHRGFVMGFDADHPFFSVTKKGAKDSLSEVVYSPRRPVMPAPDQDFDLFFSEKINILTKSHHWAYEKELRMCASPNAADEIIAETSGEPIYLFKFPDESVAEVILGQRMAGEDQRLLAGIVRKKYRSARLYRTGLNDSQYDLDVVPYSHEV